MIVGTLAYVAMVLLLRVTGKRALAQMNAFDFIVTVALGASFGRILTARNVALAEAVTTFALLLFLQFMVTWLQTRSPRFARTITAPPTLLYYRGQILHEMLKRERVSEGDLRTAVRENGAGSLEEVEAVVLESNGHFAVVKPGNAGDHSILQVVEGVDRS